MDYLYDDSEKLVLLQHELFVISVYIQLASVGQRIHPRARLL